MNNEICYSFLTSTYKKELKITYNVEGYVDEKNACEHIENINYDIISMFNKKGNIIIKKSHDNLYTIKIENIFMKLDEIMMLESVILRCIKNYVELINMTNKHKINNKGIEYISENLKTNSRNDKIKDLHFLILYLQSLYESEYNYNNNGIGDIIKNKIINNLKEHNIFIDYKSKVINIDISNFRIYRCCIDILLNIFCITSNYETILSHVNIVLQNENIINNNNYDDFINFCSLLGRINPEVKIKIYEVIDYFNEKYSETYMLTKLWKYIYSTINTNETTDNIVANIILNDLNTINL